MGYHPTGEIFFFDNKEMQQKTHGFVAMDGVFVDFRQDCDLESKSADAWMICLFSCIRTASMDGSNNSLCFFLAKVTFFVNTAPKL